AINPKGVAAYWTDMRLHATAPPPQNGWDEDAFFALVDPPPPPAAAALVVPTWLGILPEGGPINPTVGHVSAIASLTSVKFLGTSVPSTASVLVPASAGIPPQGGTTNLPDVWSLDPASVNRLADLSRTHGSLAHAMPAINDPDDFW